MRSLTWSWQLQREDQAHQALRVVSFINEGKGAAIGESPNGFDAWRSLNKALKPTSKARGSSAEPIERDEIDHGIRVIHFYTGDDDGPEMEDCWMILDTSDDEPMVRRLGEENEDVAIIIDSGADVALFPLSMADHGERVASQHKDPATRCATKSYPHTRCEKC